MRRLVAAAVCAAALVAAGLVGGGCSDDESSEGEGVTDLEEVGPDIARLEAEVTALIEQVRELQARVDELETNNPPPLR